MDSRNTLRDDIFEEVTGHGQACVQRLEEIWRLLYGDIEPVVKDRYELIKLHLKTLLDDMVKEEEELLEEYRQNLSELIKCRQTLQDELSITIEIPFEVDPSKPNVCKQVKKLTEHISKYETIKVDRLRRLVECKDKEELLCDVLGDEPQFASVSAVPSEEFLIEMEDYIASLNAEKVRRSLVCGSMITEIEELIRTLELDYVSADEEALLDRSEGATFSKARIARLEKMKAELVETKQRQIAEVAVLIEKVTLLWNLLDVSCGERDRILGSTVKGFGRSVVNAWSEEFERCEALKTLNIQSIISKLRNVIRQVWDECHIGERERSDFIYLHSENYDENLLAAHEQEHRKWCAYKNERKNVLDLCKKWFALWDKMITLENQANSNTNRFANRGGQLLKEERERKAVQKELPKVETALENLIADLENRTGTPFMYDGRPMLDTISALWEKRRIEKENEKESRKIQSRMTPLKLKSSVQTPASSAVKRGRVLNAVENVTTKKPIVVARRELKMPESVKKVVRRRSRSHDPSRRHPKETKTTAEEARGSGDVSESTVGSYAGFQAYLENADKDDKRLRSSVSPPVPPMTSSSSSRLNRSLANSSFQFKSPRSVKRNLSRKFLGSPRIRRPVLY